MVKKYIYLLSLIFIFSNSFAQKATVVNVKKEDIKNMKLLSDLIKEIPKDCDISSYVLSMVVRESEKTMTIQSGVLESWLRDGNQGTFFIEKIESGCKSKHKQKYKIIVK